MIMYVNCLAYEQRFVKSMRFYSTRRKLYCDLHFADSLATNMLNFNFVYYQFKQAFKESLHK